ncbi:MAG: Acetyltransferase domain [Patescibacteria group bacterium]|nr:Acetyltransferase domain [Patescibacteria group bacterium]
MSNPTEQLDIHPITDPFEADMAAKFIVSELWHDPKLKPVEVEAAKKHLSRMDELQIGAFDDDGRLVGVAGLANGSTLDERQWALVVDVATISDKRRSGIGTAVMAAVHDFARSKGVEEAVIVSPTKAGGALYRKLGYQWDDHADAYRKTL